MSRFLSAILALLFFAGIAHAQVVAQPPNQFWATPSSGSGFLGLRGLAASDLPFVFPLSIANGGTGTASPGLTAGFDIGITGSWPNNTIAYTGSTALPNCPVVPGLTAGGVTDNASAINAAVTAAGSGSACFSFPAGVFAINSAIPLSLGQQFWFVGAGQGATELYFPNNNNGFTATLTAGTQPGYINGSAVSFSGMDITTGQVGTASGISINGNNVSGNWPKQTNIDHVTFRGHTSTTYWLKNMAFTDLTQVVATNDDVFGAYNTLASGTGISYTGTAVGTTPVVLSVANLNGAFLSIGVDAEGYFQGVNVSQSNLTAVGTGVNCNATAQEPQCSVTNSQIAAVHHDVTLTNINNAVLANNLFYAGQFSGVLATDYMVVLANSFFDSLTGNSFGAFTTVNTPSCIDASGTAGNAYYTITGNVFATCPKAYNFATAASQIASSGNTFPSVTTILTGASTGAHNTFLDAGVGATADYFQAIDNGGTTRPTVTACGTSPLIGGTNNAGVFIVGGGTVTSCTINYAGSGFRSTSYCSLTQQGNGSGGLAPMILSAAASNFVVNWASTANGKEYFFVCFGD